ncbi:MAG: hypothetical protein Q9174_001287 [Haloplaca sp. 1 TL-2023]
MSYLYMNKYLRFHRQSHVANPLEPIPSPEYDNLRATVVAAELILLRVLGFETRIPSPMDYLQRYLERAMEDVDTVGEDYETWDKEATEEYGVVVGGISESRMGRICRLRVVEA